MTITYPTGTVREATLLSDVDEALRVVTSVDGKIRTFKRLEQYLPVKVDQMVGQSLDILLATAVYLHEPTSTSGLQVTKTRRPARSSTRARPRCST